jgi:type I restriction enzyme S subunit
MTTTINNEHKKLNVPNLRFPEFQGEWKRTIFKNVITLQRGSSPRPIIEYVTTSDDGVNWIKIGDMPHFGRIVTSTEEKITKEGAKKSRQVNKGDLILSNSMSYGLPYIMGIDGYIHDGWFVLKNFENTFDKDYLCNLLISRAIQNQYKRLAAGGVVQNISSDLVNSVSVSIPTMMEQKKISSLLNLIDERIATQNKIIDKLQSLIKGIAQKIVHSNKPNVRLSECLECKSSTLQESEVCEQGTYPVYGANGIVGYLDNYNTESEAVYIIKDGSGVGTVSYVTGKCSATGTLNTLQAKEGYSLHYLYYLLKVFNFEPYKTGMAIPHIYFKDYGKAKVFCPSYTEQLQYARLLSAIDNKLSIEQNILTELSLQKQCLLRQMFI